MAKDGPKSSVPSCVELFGTVIAGNKGWRASRQRVLSLEVHRECLVPTCTHTTNRLVLLQSYGLWQCAQICGVCEPREILVDQTMDIELHTILLPELAAALGTEVRLTDIKELTSG